MIPVSLSSKKQWTVRIESRSRANLLSEPRCADSSVSFADNIPGSGPEFIAEVEKGFAMLDTNSTGRVSTRELAQFLDTLSPRDGNHCFSQVMSHFLLDFSRSLGYGVCEGCALCAYVFDQTDHYVPLCSPIPMHARPAQILHVGDRTSCLQKATLANTRNLNPLEPACRVLNSRGKKTTSRS